MCVAVGRRAQSVDEPADFSILITDTDVAHDRHCVILTDADTTDDAAAGAVRQGFNVAAGFADAGTDVMLIIDRRLLDGAGAS